MDLRSNNLDESNKRHLKVLRELCVVRNALLQLSKNGQKFRIHRRIHE
jgi:hypothetical protein